MARYRYLSCHAVTRAQIASSLRFQSAKFNWSTTGSGTFQGKVAVPANSSARDILRLATEPKSAAIYVKDSNNLYPWGGPVVARTWNPSDGTLDITAVEWKSWLYRVFITPELDGSGDIQWSWTNIDQTTISREIVTLVTSGGSADGSPSVLFGSEAVSGRLRDLNVWGTALKSAGELIDSMANRDGGFEWTIESRVDGTDGLPRLHFVTYFPQRGGLIDNLIFKHTTGQTGGGNMIPGAIEESAVDRAERFWATGSGSAPDQIYAQDTDPNLVSGSVLRFEGKSSYGSVLDRKVLASHARRSRAFYAPGTNFLPVKHTLGKPDADSYGIGDRGRLVIEDRWADTDLGAVRVIEKSIDTAGAGIVDVTLDLNDYVLPEVDAGGTV